MSKSRGRDTHRQQPAQNTAFVAHVYEDDYREIRKLVQQYPNITTGGDLFGLWQNDSTVIVQLFIGPGKTCERTTTSFHQDIDYLHRVSSVITTEDGLSNVGEWHSHHQIGMPGPSDADQRTVFSNMPQLGLERFVLFIASIESSSKEGKSQRRSPKLDQIVLRPFLFVGSKENYIPGTIVVIPGSNPHRESEIGVKALREIENGAEPPPVEHTKRKGSTSSEEQNDRAQQKPDKRQGQEGQQPPEYSRGKKPTANVHTDDKSLRRKDDQQHKEKDLNADKSRDGRDKNNENRSPNSWQAPSTRGDSSQSTTYFPPTSPMNSPPLSGTTRALGPGNQGNMPPATSSPPSSLWKVWDNAPQPHGRTQANVSQPTNPPTTRSGQTSSFPHSPDYGNPHTGRSRGNQGNAQQQTCSRTGTTPPPFDITKLTATGYF